MLEDMEAMEAMGLCPIASTWKMTASDARGSLAPRHAKQGGFSVVPGHCDQQLREIGAEEITGPAGDVLVVRSCHSTWFFEPSKKRFRRRLKDAGNALTMWQPYFRIEVDRDASSFAIILNKAGTRILRSWRHVNGCLQCDSQTTREHSLAAIREAAAQLHESTA